MKKVISLLMCIAVIFSLSACGAQQSPEDTAAAKTSAPASAAGCEWTEYTGYGLIVRYPESWTLYSCDQSNNAPSLSVLAVSEDESIIIECWETELTVGSALLTEENEQALEFYAVMSEALVPMMTAAELEAHADDDEFLTAYDDARSADNLPRYSKTVPGTVGRPQAANVSDLPRAVGKDDGTLAYAQDEESGLYGYINKANEWVIEPAFTGALGFSEGLAAVQDPETELWGYIDFSGDFVIEPRYINAWEFSCGYAVAETWIDGYHGYIHVDKTGSVINAAPLIDYGAFDAMDGKTALTGAHPASVNIADGLSGFVNGMAIFSLRDDNDVWYHWLIDEDYKMLCQIGDTNEIKDEYGLMNSVETSEYFICSGELVIFQKQNGMWGAIDKYGGTAIPFEYEHLDNSLASENRVPAKKNEKWGYVDFEGSLVIDYVFDSVGGFENGVAPVVVNGCLGLITPQGEWIHEPDIPVTDISPNQIINGYIVVQTAPDGRYGILNAAGAYVVEPIFEQQPGAMRGGAFQFAENGLAGYLNEAGEVIIEPKYLYAGGFCVVDGEPML